MPSHRLIPDRLAAEESHDPTAMPALARGPRLTGRRRLAVAAGAPEFGLAQLLMDVAQLHPKRGVSSVEPNGNERLLSYAELLHTSSRLATRLLELGFRRGDRVVLLIRTDLASLTFFWACVLASLVPAVVGAPPALGPADSLVTRLRSVLTDLGAAGVITDHEITLPEGFETLLLKVSDIAPSAISIVPARPDPDEMAYVQFTSGTTGAPKGVVITHANVLANLEAMTAAADLWSADVFLSWMPRYHDMGLVGFHMLPMSLGCRQISIPPARFAKHPALWLRKIHQHRATDTGLSSSACRWLLGRLREEDMAGCDLSSVRNVFIGGEPLDPGDLEALEASLGRFGLSPSALYPVYGMAEATLGVSFPPPGRSPHINRFSREALCGRRAAEPARAESNSVLLVDLGTPVPGCEIRIVDQAGNVVPEGTLGHIEVAGVNVSTCYVVRGEVRRQASSWHPTGDVGFITVGRLSVLGRSCDLVQKDGGVFFAPDIERCASSEPLWRGRTIVAVPLPVASPDEQRLAIFVTPPAGQRTEANDSEVADVMARRLQAVLPVDADYLVPVRSLPRTTSGKIQRSRLAEDFMAGKYRETAIPLPSALRKEGF